MGFYNVINPGSMQAGQPEDVSQVLANLQAIAAVLNGGIDNANIAAGANIDVAKINMSAGTLNGIVPIGGLLEWGGSSDPAGGFFLLADGRAISRTGYAACFAALGTTHGAGDGSTTFNIPDCRGRVVVSPDNMGTPAGDAARLTANDARGNVGGEEKHTMTLAEMFQHRHDITHDHLIQTGASVGAGPVVARGTGTVVDLGGSGAPIKYNSGDVSGYQGSSQPANNMQPYIVVNRIIRVI